MSSQKLALCTFLILLLPAGVSFSDDSSLFEAVKEGNLDRVRSLVQQGAEVTGEDDQFASPLYYAIRNKDVRIVRLLLSFGADPARHIIPEGPGFPWGSDALALALQIKADDIVDLLVEEGADRSTVDRYYAYQIQRAFSREDTKSLDRNLAESASGGPDLIELLWFREASEEIRSVVLKHYPELETGSFGVADALGELKNTRLISFFQAPELRLPAATSALEDPNAADRYAAEKAFDGLLETSWVEGAEGAGTGEQLVFSIPRGTTGIEIFPGYGDQRYYAANNRVKTVRLNVYVLIRAPTEIATVFSTEPLADTMAEFEDRPDFQTVHLNLPEVSVPPEFGTLIAELTIMDVYPGSRWEDTCIAEVRPR